MTQLAFDFDPAAPRFCARQDCEEARRHSVSCPAFLIPLLRAWGEARVLAWLERGSR